MADFIGVGLGGVTPLTVALPTAVVQYGRSTVTMADPAPAGPSGTPVYAWTWLQQPGSATFSSTSVAQPTLTPDAAGEWVALCTVTLAGQTAYFVHTVNVGRVIYHLDWTGESTVDIKTTGDGVYALGGVNYTMVGSANTTTLDIVNGAGLVCTASGGITGNPYFQVPTASLAALSATGKRYCWLHKATLSNVSKDWESVTCGWYNSASSALAVAYLGRFSWGDVSRLDTTGVIKTAAVGTMNTTHLFGTDVDGRTYRMRREELSVYTDPRDVDSPIIYYANTLAYDRATDLLRVGFHFGASDGMTITITDSWLVEME